MFEVMNRQEIERVRATSKASGSTWWTDWYDRMAEKTVARKLFKALPLGDPARMRRMLDADALESGQAAELAYGRTTQALPAAHAVAAGDEHQREPHDDTPPPAGQGQPEPPTPAAPFKGEEPGEEAAAPPAEPSPELKAARKLVLGEAFTRYAGKPLGSVEDQEYLEWLASDAISDEELRAAAELVLEDTRG